ncbi:hypothetical protein VKT23_018050 [Stygiomarasmius scandens]|uniref:Protein-S-isoprenylcysteine O-methyltransferase n=1 Tax=Marasmiellus scandens TaxID=2682957 RepID=A0ABR1IQJ6_9AGAR
MAPYIAGIYVSHNQGVEAIVAASTLATMGITIVRQSKLLKNAASEGGNPTAYPKTLLGKLVTPMHAVTMLGIPVSYLIAVLSNSFHQPEWYTDLGGFPVELDLKAGVGGKAAIRTVAALAGIPMIYLQSWIFKTLGKQLHAIAPREKAEIVSTGPYAYVRHPGYTVATLQVALWAPAFWSWIPLVGAGVCLILFGYKTTVEEKLIEDDLTLGVQYREYKKKVPYRLIPYVY